MKQKILTFGGPPRRTAPAQARAATGKRRRRRSTGRHTLHYILILLAAFAVMTVLSLTVFFKIEQIEVKGSTKYAAEELIAQSGVKIGDNLFRVSGGSVSKKLIEKFPYVEAVQLKRILPAKLSIEITQAKPLGAVSTSTGYVIIARSGRVLEVGAQTVPEDLMVVSGMYLYSPQVQRTLGQGYKKEEQEAAEKEEESFKMLTYLVDAVAKTGFDKITLADFSDRLNMVIVYDNRVLIELGVEEKLDSKLSFAQKVITEDLSADFQGTLDASIDGGKEIWTKPGDIQSEIAKRRILPTAQAAQAEQAPADTASGASKQELPTTSGSASGASSGSSSSESSSSEESSTPPDPFSREALKTIPGTAPAGWGSSPADSASENSVDEEISQNGNLSA